MIQEKKTIIITGASSGLGAALAIRYSKVGHRLFLMARSYEKLSQVADICRESGSEVNVCSIDVTDDKEMESQLNAIASKYNIDIVIACAGVSAGTLEGAETLEQSRKIFAVNVGGVINTVLPVIPQMIKRKKGNIAIVSSMAGYIGLSSAPSYSASKGAVRLFSDALRGNLRTHGVHVTTVIPGFIKTPMTKVNNFPMPFMITADQAAEKIVNGIDRNKGSISFPFGMRFFMKILTLLPSNIIDYINSKLPGKPGFDDK